MKTKYNPALHDSRHRRQMQKTEPSHDPASQGLAKVADGLYVPRDRMVKGCPKAG